MAKKFHVNSKSEAGECHAQAKCPFGGVGVVENHFNTENEARDFYENSQENSFPTLSLDALGRAISTINLPEFLKEVAENGDKNSLRKLADNPNANNNILEIAYKRAKDPKTLTSIKNNRNYIK